MIDLAAAFGTSLLLGMRHATDPDHVVAVTTVVSRERSLGRAGGVGMLWGLGHTLTLLAVGGAIIGWRVTLSPRLGLALELAVAAMLVLLVLLGLLDLLDVRARAAPAAMAATRGPRFERTVRLASGALSIAFGDWLACGIVVEDGLFAATPRWTPK